MKKILSRFKVNKKVNEEVDVEFYHSLKTKKKIKRKVIIVNAVFCVAILLSVLAFINASKEEVIPENSATVQFMERFIDNYYNYPQSDISREFVTNYSVLNSLLYSDGQIVNVENVEILNTKTLRNSQGLIETEYNLLITLMVTTKEVVSEEETKEVKEERMLYRKITISEDRVNHQYYVKRLVSELYDFASLPVQVIVVENGSEVLSATEKNSAEIKVNLFINQYNDSYEKALDLMSEGSTLERKQEEDVYSFVQIVSATKDSSYWYVDVDISVDNGVFVEIKKMEIHFNDKNGKIEKVRVY
ncbi:MAG: hypothetical protein ACK5LZ_06130 [Anaerorhabdus sp.]